MLIIALINNTPDKLSGYFYFLFLGSADKIGDF